ncbi:MAG: ABC transporter substrate-binding protein [Dehalococcoidia bacterium]
MQDRSNFWTRNWKRRRFLSGSALAASGAATLTLVGCGDDDDDDTDGDGGGGGGGGSSPTATAVSTPTATPETDVVKRGGHLNLMQGAIRSLDPHFDTWGTCANFGTNVYNALIKFSPDITEIQTDMATSLPEQPDELTFTLNIHDNITWQDIDPANGRKLTAEDVKWSIERQMTDEAGKYQHAYFFLGAVDSIEAPDDTTVTFKMSKPYAPMMSYLASPWTVIVNREAVEKYGDLTENALGSGPFIFDKWEKDVRVSVTANPNYWKKDQFNNPLPYVDSISWDIVLDAETRSTLFIDKKMHATKESFAQLERIKGGRPDATYDSAPRQFWRQMRMSPTTAPGTEPGPYKAPFDDIQVRNAIVRAVDPQAVLDFVYSGDGILTYGPVLPIYPPWALTEPVESQSYDVAAAKALMEAAGNPTVSGPMIWATGSTEADQIGEVLKQQLAQIGVDITLEPKEAASYYDQTYKYDYFMSHHVPLNNPDPDENLSSYFGRKSAFFKHYNEDIFDIIDKQAVELDPEARADIVHEASRMIVEDYPMKFMYTTNEHRFAAPEVKNWFWEIDGYSNRLEGAWLDV